MRDLSFAVTASTFFTIVGGLFVASAHAAPVPNLPLTCPNAGAIGQPQNNCSNLTYESPTSDQLIVLRSNYTWARAATLADTDTLAVCTLPVEPGTYSACRDASNVRRIAYVQKSTVFTSSPPPPPPPPPPSGARALELSTLPVQITEPGVYVLNRSWDVGSAASGTAVVITADNVTVDLQGFELLADVLQAVIRSSGQDVTIRNGRVRAATSYAIEVSGARTRIDGVRAGTPRGVAIQLAGLGSILTNSVVNVGSDATAVSAGDDTIVRNNSLGSQLTAIRAASRVLVADNAVQCGLDFPCVVVEGSNTIVSGNELSERFGLAANGLVIRGNFNHALDNVFSPTQCSAGNNRAAIVVDGQGNTVRDNLVPSCNGVPGWPTGIAFLRDGNFYGDNIVWATVPFNLGATVQTDLGGNVGISQ